VSNARNVGINKASSEWIMFVDADDYLEDDCCTTLLSYVDEGIDLIVGEAKAFKNQTIKDQLSNNKIVIQNSKEKKELTESIFFGNNNFPKYIFIGCPWGKLFKKEVITKNNLKFKENLRNYEDGIFNTEYIYYASKIIIFEKYVYNYIIYNNSSSRKFEIKMLDDYEEVYKEMSLIENKYNYDFSKYMDSFKVKNLVYIFKRYSLSHEFNCSIIKKICNSNTYVSSIYNVDLKSLKRRCALTTIFARAHLYFAIYFLYKIK
jgi:glycosyltransferase involved in cell wall biosynthesis